MATNKGATMHLHSDYKVQQEFERVAKNTSSLTSSFNFQQTAGSGGSGGGIQEPTLWALTLMHNGEIKGSMQDKKVVQAIDFKDVQISGKYLHSDVLFELTKKDLANDLKTLPEAITIEIQAFSKTSVVELVNLIRDYLDRIVIGKNSIKSSFSVDENKWIVQLVNDELMPGELCYYGTDYLGNKGYHSLANLSNQPFTFTVNVPLKTWVIEHNLSRNVTAIYYNNEGKRMFGNEQKITWDKLEIKFKTELTGYGICL